LKNQWKIIITIIDSSPNTGPSNNSTVSQSQSSGTLLLKCGTRGTSRHPIRPKATSATTRKQTEE
jgi:hypothetical protein